MLFSLEDNNQDNDNYGEYLGKEVSRKTASKQGNLLNNLIDPIDKLQDDFKTKSGKKPRKNKYREFSKKAMQIIFDFDSNTEINGIDEETFRNGDYEIHHKIPVSQVESNPDAMTDFSNFAPLSSEDHRQADKNNTLKNGEKVDSISDTVDKIARKEKLKNFMISFFDVFYSALVVGFLSEWIYGFLYQKLILHKPITADFQSENFGAATACAIKWLLWAIPSLVISQILVFFNVTEKTINIVQTVFMAMIFLYMTIRELTYRHKNKENPWLALLHIIFKLTLMTFLFGISEIIELKISHNFWQYVVSDAFLIVITILVRLISDLLWHNPSVSNDGEQTEMLKTSPVQSK